MVKAKRILTIMLWAAVAGSFLISSFAEANPKEAENENNAFVQRGAEQPPKSKNVLLDSFTLAIIGISLGSMGLVSRLHFHHTRWREIKAGISALDEFLKGNTCVDIEIHHIDEDEPMEHGLQVLDKECDEMIQEIEKRRDQLSRTISRISTDVMRVLG